jgi:ribosomal protein S8
MARVNVRKQRVSVRELRQLRDLGICDIIYSSSDSLGVSSTHFYGAPVVAQIISVSTPRHRVILSYNALRRLSYLLPNTILLISNGSGIEYHVNSLKYRRGGMLIATIC